MSIQMRSIVIEDTTARQPENMSTEALEQAMKDAGFHGFPELDDHQAARLGAIISEWARR